MMETQRKFCFAWTRCLKSLRGASSLAWQGCLIHLDVQKPVSHYHTATNDHRWFHPRSSPSATCCRHWPCSEASTPMARWTWHRLGWCVGMTKKWFLNFFPKQDDPGIIFKHICGLFKLICVCAPALNISMWFKITKSVDEKIWKQKPFGLYTRKSLYVQSDFSLTCFSFMFRPVLDFRGNLKLPNLDLESISFTSCLEYLPSW